ERTSAMRRNAEELTKSAVAVKPEVPHFRAQVAQAAVAVFTPTTGNYWVRRHTVVHAESLHLRADGRNDAGAFVSQHARQHDPERIARDVVQVRGASGGGDSAQEYFVGFWLRHWQVDFGEPA